LCEPVRLDGARRLAQAIRSSNQYQHCLDKADIYHALSEELVVETKGFSIPLTQKETNPLERSDFHEQRKGFAGGCQPLPSKAYIG